MNIKYLLAATVLIAVSLQWVDGQNANIKIVDGDNLVTLADIKSMCPKEKASCWARAHAGRCVGSMTDPADPTRDKVISKAAQIDAFWKECNCSCRAVMDHRITPCCKAINSNYPKDKQRDDCLDMCSYGLMGDVFMTPQALSCITTLGNFMYCVTEGFNNTDCCVREGVTKECTDRGFCTGGHDPFMCGVATLDVVDRCSKQSRKVYMCHFERLSNQTLHWQSDWTAPAECNGGDTKKR